jgi:UDP-N-acetylmuramoyl-L-alanyl-D-glutamate--2,6-diaminopimelate ligase
MNMDKYLRVVEKLIPKQIYRKAQPIYHFGLAFVGKFIYGFPSSHIKIIAVTGTKGKSSTCEFMNAILEEAGYKTALLSTIRFKIGNETRANMFKMTMPGRFFVQKFLRDAVDANCDFAIVEMTSEGAKFYRHHGVRIDTLLFTNLTPEHIESHGTFENYKKAKLSLAKAVEKSNKPVRTIVSNLSDLYGNEFLDFKIENKLAYTEPDSRNIKLSVDGEFNKLNALACKTYALSLGISEEIIDRALLNLKEIPGRVQHIHAGQKFQVIVDYAHTVESLEKLYQTYQDKFIISVLGSCGGGRDRKKRPLLGQVADKYSKAVIVTDEDPYDDDPMEIISEVASGVTSNVPQIYLDRREAIAHALDLANKFQNTQDVTVLITGKGTDPYIMRANGKKEPWSDAKVAREEIEKILM